MTLAQQFDITQAKVASGLGWEQAFGAWLFHAGKARNTISAYLQDARHFATFFEAENGEAFDPCLLNATDVKKYFARQDADKSVAPRSRNRRLASLRVMVRWSVEINVLEYDPTVAIKREKVKTIPRDRTVVEMQALHAVVENGSHLCCATERHAWLGKRDRMIWILSKDAGLREFEVCSVEIGDVDFAQNRLYVMGKGGKKDFVTLSAQTMDEIAAWLNVRPAGKSQALVTDWYGNKITRSQVWRRIKMLGAAAKVDNLRPHDLRHTFGFSVAESLMKQGLPQLTVMNGVRDQLRHGDVKTSALYFGIRESQIRAAMEAR